MTRLLRTCPSNLCCSSCRCECRTPAYWLISSSEVGVALDDITKRCFDYTGSNQLHAQPPEPQPAATQRVLAMFRTFFGAVAVGFKDSKLSFPFFIQTRETRRGTADRRGRRQ